MDTIIRIATTIGQIIGMAGTATAVTDITTIIVGNELTRSLQIQI